MLLSAADSPFMRQGDVRLDDLRRAVGICQLGFDDSQIRPPKLGWRGLLLLGRKDGRRGEVIRFLEYAGSYFHKPEYTIHALPLPKGMAPRPRRGSAPRILRPVADVATLVHGSQSEIWHLPVGRAEWYVGMAARAKGEDIDFLNDEERDFQEEMKTAELAQNAPATACPGRRRLGGRESRKVDNPG